MRTLVLGSQSPRRKEILMRAGFAAHTLIVEVSEFLEKNLTLEEALQGLVRRKAEAVLASPQISAFSDFLLLTADTVVVQADQVLGKPASDAEAIKVLKGLSGKAHRVMTSVCLFDSRTSEFKTGVVTTKVWFRELKESEILDYVATGEPMDKAGSYAIQGGARTFVERFEGPLDNVVGLPMALVYDLLGPHMSIAERWSAIGRRVQQAKKQSERSADSVTIVAVSKLQPNERVLEGVECGIQTLGENYVQELLKKKAEFPEGLNWHLIGPLQSNKAAKVVGEVALIHSVDRVSLVDQISQAALKKGVVQDVLLQVNIAAEPSKAGFSVKEALDLSPRLAEWPGVRILGLMTMPPETHDAESSRQHFRALAQLLKDMKSRNASVPYFAVLSMGTSQDFEIAIEEGATHVRVGSTIFGSR